MNTCPKCGAEPHSPKHGDHWMCGSQFVKAMEVHQSDKCRIRELELQLAAASFDVEERNAGAESLARIMLADNGKGDMGPGPCRDLEVAWREMKCRIRELEAELAKWKPLTPEEAEKALDGMDAEPLSEERIAAIVKAATDPAYSPTNEERAILTVKRIRELEAENAELRKDKERLIAELMRWTCDPTVSTPEENAFWK